MRASELSSSIILSHRSVVDIPRIPYLMNSVLRIIERRDRPSPSSRGVGGEAACKWGNVVVVIDFEVFEQKK